MRLITKEIERELLKAPLHSTDGKSKAKVIVKLFTPWSNWTWYAIEGQKRGDGDWEFFGLVEGLETELGYFVLSELQSVTGPGGLKVERDRYFDRGMLDKETTKIERAA